MPIHLSIIPDGNRRWATGRGLKNIEGYKAVNYEHLESLVIGTKKLGVKYMSLWIFSTENWKRPKVEINFLFSYFLNNVDSLLKGALKNKIKIKHIGRKDRLPKEVIESLNKLEEATKNFDEFTLILAMDYGGRDEIVRVVNKFLRSGKQEVSEDDFSRALDTSEIPDVELIIRTGGENRVSGFMSFQGAYAEFWFVDKFFPDFTGADLREAVLEFCRRGRRFGS